MVNRFASFVFCLSICMALAITTNAHAEYVTYNADDINPAYQRVFGRDAKPDEFAYWSRNDIRAKFKKDICGGAVGYAADKLTHSDCMQMSHNAAKYMLRQQLVSYFRTPEGGPELKATIDRSYRAAFNRLPNPEELAYWQAELKKPHEKAEHVGYEYLIIAHKKWTQTSVKPEERLALINAAYSQVYGRAPLKKETDFWMADIPKKGVLYADLCNYLKDWVSGNSKEQIQELEELIRRAYARAAVNGPSPEQMKTAMNYVTSSRPFFSQLVEWVKKQPAVKLPAGAAPVKVPSFKR